MKGLWVVVGFGVWVMDVKESRGATVVATRTQTGQRAGQVKTLQGCEGRLQQKQQQNKK